MVLEDAGQMPAVVGAHGAPAAADAAPAALTRRTGGEAASQWDGYRLSRAANSQNVTIITDTTSELWTFDAATGTFSNGLADGASLVRAGNDYLLTDSGGKVQEVRGDGVVGKQPVLKPGEVFEYASGAPLTTPSGIMAGTYQMVSESGEAFDVEIPAFSLDSPQIRSVLH